MTPIKQSWIQAATYGLHTRLYADTNVSGLVVGGFGGAWGYGDCRWDITITQAVYNNHKADFDKIDVREGDRLKAHYISQRPASGPSDWTQFVIGRKDANGVYSEKDYLNE